MTTIPSAPPVDVRDVLRVLNRHYAGGWELGQILRPFPGAVASLVQRPSRRTVAISLIDDTDGHQWIHASTAHPTEMPTYDDLKALHRAVYADRHAYQAFVPADQHVNFHEYALHLWGRADGADVIRIDP